MFMHVLCYCNLLFNLCLFFLLYFVTDLPFLLFFPLAMTRPNASAESNTSLFLPKITNDVSSPSDDEVEAEGDDSHSNANRDRVNLPSMALSDSCYRSRTCESRFLLRRDSLWYFSSFRPLLACPSPQYLLGGAPGTQVVTVRRHHLLRLPLLLLLLPPLRPPLLPLLPPLKIFPLILLRQRGRQGQASGRNRGRRTTRAGETQEQRWA
jgi:hypothetical protein